MLGFSHSISPSCRVRSPPRARRAARSRISPIARASAPLLRAARRLSVQICLRPALRRSISPAPSSTFTCLAAPAKLIANGSPSSPIDFSPSARLASIPRRVGSDKRMERGVESLFNHVVKFDRCAVRLSTIWFNDVSSVDKRLAAGQRKLNRAALTSGGDPIREPHLPAYAVRCLACRGRSRRPRRRPRPRPAPTRYFTGSDLFNLEWATDPQISPDGRTIAYVRQSNDIMTDQARRRSGWSMSRPASSARCSPAPAPISRRAGRPTARASPMSRRTAAARSCTCAGWRAARARASPACPTARARSPGRPTAAASPIRCSFPTKAPTLGKAPPKPEGAKWADPLQVIDAVTYRADGAGYLKPGYDQIFWVPADGGAPTQLTFGATNAGGQVSWTPDGRVDPVQRQSVEELGARAGRQRNLPDRASTAARRSR